jgi:hypothetical protein
LPLKLSPFRATALGKTVITCAPVLMNEMNEALPAADYVIFAILVAMPAVIVWFALSRHEF